METEEGKIDFIKAAAGILRALSPVEAEVYIKKLAGELRIAEGAIKMEILGNTTNVPVPGPLRRNLREKEEVHDSLTPLEASLLKTLFVNPVLTERLLDFDQAITSRLGRKVKDILFELYGLSGDFQLEQVQDRLEPEESEVLAEALSNVVICGNEEQVFEQCINTWQLQCLSEREQDIITRLSLADEEKNPESIEALTRELMEVQQEINSHGGRK